MASACVGARGTPWERGTVRSDVVVAWYGPDGAGKSTLVERVHQRLRRADPACVVERRHWRPCLVPGPVRRRGNVDVTNPHGQGARSRSVAAVRDVLVGIDFGLWWARHVIRRPWTRDSVRVVLWERYLDDACLDPVRYRRPGSSSVLRLLAKLLPPVDLVVIVAGDPTTIASRKHEVTAERTAEALDRLRDHPFRARDRVWLDTTSDPVDACVDTVLARLGRAAATRSVT